MSDTVGAENGKRVLLTEDEILIGMDLAMMLEDWGYVVDGPHGSSRQAMEALNLNAPDLAILDVNLGNNDTSLPIAQELNKRDAPFIFLTGYNPSRYAGDDVLKNAPHMRKPVQEHALRKLLDEIAQTV
tara:strand:- start:10159 stop:10545 length:387 start_codon:yes stop_codon:yes gene_type:complete